MLSQQSISSPKASKIYHGANYNVCVCVCVYILRIIVTMQNINAQIQHKLYSGMLAAA